ncbi:beta-glucanase (GH16 family) [Marmoricola sp. OAE513]|uniref:family 16 glycosylhydrolase n=1 Tax=Marmoricola sp. OAE513 TaxID=2817894 RepID=UPI001AE7DCA5
MKKPQAAVLESSRTRGLAAAAGLATISFVLLALALPDTAASSAGPSTSVNDPANPSDEAPAGDPGTGETDPFAKTPDPRLPTPTIVASAPDVVGPSEAATITVTITGVAAEEEIVSLETSDEDVWTSVGSATVADGEATLSVTQEEPASYAYRVQLSGTTKHEKATSDVFAIRVAATPVEEPSETPAPTPTEPPPPPGPDCGGTNPAREDGSTWICTYDDEFDGSSLDRRYWLVQKSATSAFFSGTTTNPACYLDDPRTVDVRGGQLVLGAVLLDEAVSCGKKSSRMVSGMVSHKGTFSQTYGRYEVRAKIPSFAGNGLQETFWLWPDDVLKYGYPHPMSGEIDFGEYYSNYVNLNIPVMHYVFDWYTVNFQTNTNIYTAWNCTINVGQFNTYVLEWSPGLMKIYVNGKVCITNNYKASNAPAGSPYAPFDSPFFLALTQAFGTTGNEFDPATGPRESATVVDYVRVWR